MSEYGEKHSVSRLIGAPPGYVGYEQGGQLTEAVRRRPYSVLLFDEIEKAHPEIFNVFLQILDDGRLTDGQGRVVDFKNCIIIMTSNLGSDLILESRRQQDGGGEESRQKESPRDLGKTIEEELNELLRQHFRPEFLNRIDERVIFNRLGREEIGRIVEIQARRLIGRLAERKIGLILTDSAKDFLAERGYDPLFGARPLKRTIQSELENPLAKSIIAGKIREGETLTADASAEGLVFRASLAKEPL
jgi:ATP-dependent Clp protease ATP-binding subunit ClpB